TFALGRIVDDVINTPRCFMNAASAETLYNFFVGNVNLDDVIDIDTCINQCFRLRNGARETVKKKSVGAVTGADTFLYQGDDQIIGNQTTSSHNIFCLQSERRTCFNRSAQHITGGNLWNAKFLHDQFRLRTFTRARRTQKYDSHYGLLLYISSSPPLICRPIQRLTTALWG